MFTALGARRRGRLESTRDFGLALAASCASLMVGFYFFDAFGFDEIANTTFVPSWNNGRALAPRTKEHELTPIDLLISQVLADG